MVLEGVWIALGVLSAQGMPSRGGKGRLVFLSGVGVKVGVPLVLPRGAGGVPCVEGFYGEVSGRGFLPQLFCPS